MYVSKKKNMFLVRNYPGDRGFDTCTHTLPDFNFRIGKDPLNESCSKSLICLVNFLSWSRKCARISSYRSIC